MSATPVTFFNGTVLKTDPVTYLVDVTAQAAHNMMPVITGIAIAPSFSRLFGYKDCVLPEPGSTVLCLRIDAQRCYVLGTVVEADLALAGVPLRTVQRATDGCYDDMHTAGSDYLHKQYTHNCGRPSDVIEGERVISNDFGVMLQLLQQCAALKASDLAQVQVHLLDDLVRIISHNFEHFSSMGFSKVVQDGKYLHAEYGATHLPSEALGQTDGGDIPFKTTTGDLSTADDENDVVDFQDKSMEGLTAIERLKVFVGTLGDIINLFVVSPVAESAHYLDGTKPDKDDTGVLQVQATTDGALHIRSAKEIFLEKTNWIRVPTRIREFEDPKGTDGSVVILPQKDVYEFNQEYKKNGIPFLYALQAQDYAAHANEVTGYANFKAYSDDVYVPDDRSKATNLKDITKTDPTTNTKLIATKAGVYILPNGGIMLKEACGAAIILEGGNIYIQPANDLFLQPMRHIYSLSGGITSIQSTTEIEIAAKHVSVAGYEGVTVYADKNDLAFHSNSDIVSKAKGSSYTFADNLILQATSNIEQKADNLFTEVDGNYSVTSTGKSGAITLCANGSTLISANIVLELLSNKTVYIAGDTNTVIGKDSQILGVADAGDLGSFPVKGTIKDLSQSLSEVAQIMSINITDMYPRFNSKGDRDKYVFTFNSDSIVDVIIPQTVAQQESKKFSRAEETKDFPFAEVNLTQPFPGKDNQKSYAVNKKALSNLDVESGNLYNKTNDLDTKPTIDLESLSSYKFYTLT